ncbi:hypothetical protein J3998_03350 [Thiomicrorhabdus sp. 6S2-11]|uniref:Esterase YqiA n=1 Tax=Thiomicrorhabdus marina TaxID=2818442 RepID=A0ABS3Q2R5_9GAMM|nr:YqiA/YcfP family alpha/beta fold hydrolase [Thiomicrorhabdus marina]MBO1926602.1 hypothetical protein [Thiomicrorhabdus marina]
MASENTPSTIKSTQIKSLYLHGFLSSGKSQKGQWLLTANHSKTEPPLGELYCPTYSQKNLLEGVQSIQEQLLSWREKGHPLLLIGSSLGGYLAQYFAHHFNCPYVMINPALNPVSLLSDYLGTHQNPYTNETVVVDEELCGQLQRLNISTLNPKLPSLLLADHDDEVVDIEFAVQLYANKLKDKHRTFIYPGGTHAFTHMPEAWLEIQKFIQVMREESVF